MREILFFYIMFIVVGNSKVFAEPNTVQGNRELVSAILNKMPESTTNESKIVRPVRLKSDERRNIILHSALLV